MSFRSSPDECNPLAPVFHRLNFLLQISQLYSNVSSELSRCCYNHSRMLSRKKLARIDSNCKHKWCNHCYSHLIAGRTSEITVEHNRSKSERKLNDSINNKSRRNRSSEQSVRILTKCVYCNKKKRIFYSDDARVEEDTHESDVGM